MTDVQTLFASRDKAVRTNNRELFESTQVSEPVGMHTATYLGMEDLQTEILATCDETDDLTKVVFAKEVSTNRHSFVMYGLINTVAGWKIYSITHRLFQFDTHNRNPKTA